MQPRTTEEIRGKSLGLRSLETSLARQMRRGGWLLTTPEVGDILLQVLSPVSLQRFRSRLLSAARAADALSAGVGQKRYLRRASRPREPWRIRRRRRRRRARGRRAVPAAAAVSPIRRGPAAAIECETSACLSARL